MNGSTNSSSPIDHVALVFLAPYLSGAEHQTLALARYLRRHCRVSVLTSSEVAATVAGKPWLREMLEDVDVVALGPAFAPMPLAQRLNAYAHLQRAAAQYLRANPPDVVHLLLLPTFWLYAPLFYVLPLPTVVTMAGELRYHRLRFYSWPRRLVLRHALWHADAIIACSADERQALHRMGMDWPDSVVTLDNFTDPQRFQAVSADQKEPLVTWAGRLHYEKDPEVFVAAAALVRRSLPGTRFALLGQGEREPQVRRLVQARGLASAMQLGYVSDTAPVLARSSVFVSCQRYENLGSSSLLEAMASENAIVATAVGHTAQIVDDTVGGLVQPTAEAIASEVAGLLTDPPRRQSAGRAARLRVIERYGPEAYVRRLMHIYAAAVRHAGRRV